MSEVFYAQATMNDGNVAVRYPRLANELRLTEAFWLAQVVLRQVDQHLEVIQEWPNQLNEIGQYARQPVGEYTQQVVVKPQWVEIQVDLVTVTGEVERVGLVVYYGSIPPTLGSVDYVPVWLAREALEPWLW